MLGDVLIQTLDGKVYFSEGGKAFELLEFQKSESAVALAELLQKSKGQAVGVATVVHGQFATEHMLNGGAIWFLGGVEKTIAGTTDTPVAEQGSATA